MTDSRWQTMTVPPLTEEGRVRLDAWLAKHLEGVSRSKVQAMIEGGKVRVNEGPATGKQVVKAGDVIDYMVPERATTLLQPVAMVLDILFEDDHLIVLNKPAGISVHPGAGESGPTMVHGLIYHSSALSQLQVTEEDDEAVNERPGIVHRLDKETTGVMVVAKTDQAHAHLAKQFHDKTNFRQYIALLDGSLPEGEWVRESWLHRDHRDRTRFASMDMEVYNRKRDEEGQDLAGYRYAKSLFKLEAGYGPLSLVSIRLFTGRTHQIRIHARDIGAPVFGDQTYGKAPSWAGKTVYTKALENHLVTIKRQMLHAWILGFTHPVTGVWQQFEAPLPADFATVVASLQKWTQADS